MAASIPNGERISFVQFIDAENRFSIGFSFAAAFPKRRANGRVLPFSKLFSSIRVWPRIRGVSGTRPVRFNGFSFLRLLPITDEFDYVE